jgi:phosphoribosyl-AMP cyclohydrolase
MDREYCIIAFIISNYTGMTKEDSIELLLDFGKDGQKLVPVVTQHSQTKAVLILAYTNKEAFEETLHSGYATYYSRSRKEIWKKGSSSGDFLRIEEIRINCEQNSLLYIVTPEGKGVCHAKKPDGIPYPTCYYRRILPDGKLVIVEK